MKIKLKVPKNKRSIWLLSLNSTYADDLARLAYQTFGSKNIPYKLVAFPNVIEKVKAQYESKKIKKKIYNENPFKFLLIDRNLVEESIIVSPSYLSIFFILFLRLKLIKVVSIIHNHPKFKSDNNLLKDINSKLISFSSIILSDKIIFTAPHIKVKWENTKIFKLLNLSKKCSSFKRLFLFDEPLIKVPKNKNFYFSNLSETKIIHIYSWGRSTPYKDLSILHKIFENSETYLKDFFSLNLIHYGITSSSQPYLSTYENSSAQLSIINRRPSFKELNYIHIDADYIIFPYSDLSQSGPIRFAMEYGSNVLVPKLDGSIDQLSDYKNKFLFNPKKLNGLFSYLNQNFG